MTQGSPVPLTLALAVVAFVYLRGWFRFRPAFPNVIPLRRVVAFMGGLLAVWVAVASPLVHLDHHLLTMHMVKHLLLMIVGAPLILWGTPVPPLFFGVPKGLHLSTLFRSPVLQFTGRCLGNPVLCWLASAAAVIVWHLPAAFQLALESHTWHSVEDASFLVAGLLFWWPVVQPWPTDTGYDTWTVPLYLFLATLPCDILSGFLVFCGRVVYPSYLAAPRLFDLSPLQDQEFAGALMWVSVTIIYAIPAAVIMVRVLSPMAQHAPERV
jgi:cytochrome c oxidase assembly factor CtaG